MKDYGQPDQQRRIRRLPGGVVLARQLFHPMPAKLFKRSVFIALGQIARNPFFFFWLVFLVTRRDAARLARRVGFWARRAGD